MRPLFAEIFTCVSDRDSLGTTSVDCRLMLRRSISYKIRCAIERLEKSLMRLTEVALVTECRFVDSSGSVREVFESSFPIG